MKKLIFAALLTASISWAQNTPPPVPPVPPAVPPVPGTEQKPAGEQKPADAKVEKVKPLSPNDQKFAKKASEILQWQLKIAERARGLKEKQPALAEWAGKKQKEFTDRWTPFATMCGKYGYSDVATDISKKEASDIAKLNKVKEEKFNAEYLELFAKEAKTAFKDMENAPKMVQNAELKSWGETFATLLKTNADEIEAKFKEEKKKK
jgi:hypothetical protein